MPNTKQLSRSIVLNHMRIALRNAVAEGNDRYGQIMAKTLKALSDSKLYSLTQRHHDEEFGALRSNNVADQKTLIPLQEAYNYLTMLGYIVPKPSPPNAPDGNSFFVTETGKEWAAEADFPLVEDADGYIEYLRTKVQQIDPTIVQYVSEALATYERRTYFASSVMIGAAAEKSVYLLLQAIQHSTTDTVFRSTIQNAMDKRGIPSLLKLIQDAVKRARSNASSPMSYDVFEGVETHLVSLFETIRVQRNDAVHPIVGKVSAEGVRLSLHAFPGACEKLYHLLAWFQSHSF